MGNGDRCAVYNCDNDKWFKDRWVRGYKYKVSSVVLNALSAYDVKFFIILLERAFKMMKNGIYFIVTSFCGHEVM